MIYNPINTDNSFQPIERDNKNIKEIFNIDKIHEKEETEDQNNKKQQTPDKKKEEAKDHFDELTRAAATAHITLVKNRSPYRFCVYKKEEDIFIDIVLLDDRGKIKETIKKNITHVEFQKVLQDIDLKEGLFFDRTV
ncbi:MAG: hypothetical protein KAI43_04005 [Candidatus Aureabacteria bacterium]|nr:hypothetical protein [Candidatus Auribacterota bacterium]